MENHDYKAIWFDEDDLAEALRTGNEAIIKEANNWLPLAHHVMGIIKMVLDKEHGKVC